MRKDHGPDSGNWRGRRVCSLSPGDYKKNTAIHQAMQKGKQKQRKQKNGVHRENSTAIYMLNC